MIKNLFGLIIKQFKNQKGTSLIETLVSIFIVFLIFQLTYITAFSAGQTVKSRHNTSASIYAVSLIEAIRTEDIETGLYQAENDFLGIIPPEGMEAQVLLTDIENRPFLAVIEVTVRWMEGSQENQLEMQSMVRKDHYEQ